MKTDLTNNFNQIYSAISNKGIKRTAFAKSMGYSSTAQLATTLEGDALISTKAVIELVKNFNISPTFLFTGQGPIFLPEKDEIDELREQIKFIEKQRDSSNEIAEKLAEMVKILEKRNGDLIDMTSLALKNYKEEQEKKTETTENK